MNRTGPPEEVQDFVTQKASYETNEHVNQTFNSTQIDEVRNACEQYYTIAPNFVHYVKD